MEIVMGLVVIPKRYGEAAIYDWTPGKRIMGLLVVVVIERCCWIWMSWLFLILWVVGGGKGLYSIHEPFSLLAGRRRIKGVAA